MKAGQHSAQAPPQEKNGTVCLALNKDMLFSARREAPPCDGRVQRGIWPMRAQFTLAPPAPTPGQIS